jgi:hypothetical protein
LSGIGGTKDPGNEKQEKHTMESMEKDTQPRERMEKICFFLEARSQEPER